MRDIKFRAWDEETEEMIYDIGLTPESDGPTPYKIAGKDFDQFLYYPNSIKMQYTGLKDKNGKEIYDEYIVQQYRDICIVKRCVGGFECKMILGPHKGATFLFNYLSEKHCEIIGTSFENPELIEHD